MYRKVWRYQIPEFWVAVHCEYYHMMSHIPYIRLCWEDRYIFSLDKTRFIVWARARVVALGWPFCSLLVAAIGHIRYANQFISTRIFYIFHRITTRKRAYVIYIKYRRICIFVSIREWGGADFSGRGRNQLASYYLWGVMKLYVLHWCGYIERAWKRQEQI